MSFSKDFVWGTAAASYQVEGAYDTDGRGMSVWDEFTRIKDKILDNANGNVACDQYHLYRDDVALMKKLGYKAHRFSFSWSRILPGGIGKANEKGLDYYDRFIDSMLENDVVPYATLFHWDYPYELYKKGGWLNDDSSEWFAEFAAHIAWRYSDRVKHYFTQNEAQCFIYYGHHCGYHAPGLSLSDKEFFICLKNSQLAHGKAVTAMRNHAKGDIYIGTAPTCVPGVPMTDTPEDIEAARKYTFRADKDDLTAGIYVDPIILGKYPDGMEKFGDSFVRATDEELKIMSPKLDFLGFNLYVSNTIKAADNENGYEKISYPGTSPRTGNTLPVTPEALYWGPKFLIDRYKLPFYVTESGMVDLDIPDEAGEINDYARIDYLKRYIKQYQKIAGEGYPVKGYFAWSFIDNFEWNAGYRFRLGLVYVDYPTQKRTPKKSAGFYSDVIRDNGVF